MWGLWSRVHRRVTGVRDYPSRVGLLLRRALCSQTLTKPPEHTPFLNHKTHPPSKFETPGLQTSVQDYPGRVGLWRVGVPPSGPMDSLGHRLANALVGNDEDAATLEFGLTGEGRGTHGSKRTHARACSHDPRARTRRPQFAPAYKTGHMNPPQKSHRTPQTDDTHMG